MTSQPNFLKLTHSTKIRQSL